MSKSKFLRIVCPRCYHDQIVFGRSATTIKCNKCSKKLIDTTGAGDLYAAGFLWGYTHEKPLEICGRIGAFMASRVIAQVGAILEEPFLEQVQKIN